MTPEHLQAAIDLYHGGLTIEQTAKRVGYGRMTICRVFREAGVKCRPPGHRPRTEEQVLRAIEMYVVGGMSARDASKVAGIGYDTLRAEITARGIAMRKSGRKRTRQCDSSHAG